MNPDADAMQGYMAVVERVDAKLTEYLEWIKRYADYAEAIEANLPLIGRVRQSMREWKPLYLYLSIGSVKDARKKVAFDVRYRGQSVATLNGDGVGLRLSTKGKYDKNREHFGCSLQLDDVPWRSAEASAFRSFFKQRVGQRLDGKKKNDEHRIESLLLGEFTKRQSTDKLLLQIRPVLLEEVRFAVTTPITASKHNKIEYAGYSGGGIDILARTTLRAGVPALCVIEVKDENKKSEPPHVVMEQALAYAEFLRLLLRSPSGATWWRLFGFERALPASLTIATAIAMPDKGAPLDEFAEQTIVRGQDRFVLHVIYFTEKNNVLTGVRSSLGRPGPLGWGDPIQGFPPEQ